MITETLPVGIFECNCTVLGDEGTRRALVIDPGDEPEAILDRLRRHDLILESILHTHAHIDHIGATKALAEATGARILLHPGDRYLYEKADLQAQVLGLPIPEVKPVDVWVEDGDEVRFGGIVGEIIHTPGHSPGSICFEIPAPTAQPPRLFSGDTLFSGSIGRTDLMGGDTGALLRSIRRRLLTLPDETRVIPGHGPMTDIGRERRSNPFLLEDDREMPLR
jgi:glyoxylase-like metal-dependent hydrolase (beta-lactamase superfamily II)